MQRKHKSIIVTHNKTRQQKSNKRTSWNKTKQTKTKKQEPEFDMKKQEPRKK